MILWQEKLVSSRKFGFRIQLVTVTCLLSLPWIVCAGMITGKVIGMFASDLINKRTQ